MKNMTGLDADRARRREVTRNRIEDLAWLLEMGEHRDRACKRLGWNVETARKTLGDYGRRDLLDLFFGRAA